ncbi:MAG: hypothetical protein JW787_00765 [Sedimentisphaerales bacterium]|nr:hypothetical protein [Sedimentisphaerales bacterium]
MKKLIITAVFVISVMFSACAYSLTLSPAESLEAIAARLVTEQNPNGYWGGLDEWDYTGPIVAGLVQAYEITNNTAYKEAAERGADFIIWYSDLNFLGDEAYALARLGEVTGNQVYTDIVRDFYNGLDTYKYISGYNYTTAEKSVFYISFHAAASYLVDANDAGIWREAVIQYLSQVNDDISYFPVMTLGAATWAIALTGPMDDTLIDPFGLSGVDYWKDVKLCDLPDILSTHQVLSGEHAGSFYVRYDHAAPGTSFYEAGYTEDSIFGLLGLISANNYREDINDIEGIDPNNIIVIEDNVNDPGVKQYKLRIWNFDREIQDARDALIKAVDQTGVVQVYILDNTMYYFMYYFFGGEMLEVYDSEYIYPKEESVQAIEE